MKNNLSVKNSLDFINRIKDIKLQPSYRITSFDIVNLYTNVPVNDTLEIVRIKYLDFETNFISAAKESTLSKGRYVFEKFEIYKAFKNKKGQKIIK